MAVASVVLFHAYPPGWDGGFFQDSRLAGADALGAPLSRTHLRLPVLPCLHAHAGGLREETARPGADDRRPVPHLECARGAVRGADGEPGVRRADRLSRRRALPLAAASSSNAAVVPPGADGLRAALAARLPRRAHVAILGPPAGRPLVDGGPAAGRASTLDQRGRLSALHRRRGDRTAPAQACVGAAAGTAPRRHPAGRRVARRRRRLRALWSRRRRLVPHRAAPRRGTRRLHGLDGLRRASGPAPRRAVAPGGGRLRSAALLLRVCQSAATAQGHHGHAAGPCSLAAGPRRVRRTSAAHDRLLPRRGDRAPSHRSRGVRRRGRRPRRTRPARRGAACGRDASFTGAGTRVRGGRGRMGGSGR